MASKKNKNAVAVNNTAAVVDETVAAFGGAFVDVTVDVMSKLGDFTESDEPRSVAATVDLVREAPAVKPERKPSTKANSGHAYAILGAYRFAKRGGFDPMAAMRDEVDSIPAAIRGAAVKLAMKHDDPNGACQTFLKALHAEQAIEAPKATKAKTRGPLEGDTLTVRKNNEELCVRWLGSDRIGQTFTQKRVVVDGKLIITLTQASIPL